MFHKIPVYVQIRAGPGPVLVISFNMGVHMGDFIQILQPSYYLIVTYIALPF